MPTQQITIPLVVTGVDLDDAATLDLVGAHFDDLTWHSESGQHIATLYTAAADPISAAVEVADAISAELPGARVTGIDPQLVALGDIADRLNISSEAVRLWAAGKRRAHTPFPAPAGHVSVGRTVMKIWSWPDVLTWLREGYHLDPEPNTTYLTASQTHRLAVKLDNARITAALLPSDESAHRGGTPSAAALPAESAHTH
jgi:hypothetical protein